MQLTLNWFHLSSLIVEAVLSHTDNEKLTNSHLHVSENIHQISFCFFNEHHLICKTWILKLCQLITETKVFV